MDRPVVLFDVFRTLLEFDGDRVEEGTFEHLATWLAYRGVRVEAAALQELVAARTGAHLEAAGGQPPDVDVRAVWTEVLGRLESRRDAPWDLAPDIALEYRQITTRHIDLWPGTLDMLDACAGLRLGVVSNTQRAYTEAELAMFDLLDRFDVVVFSSDVGAVKPDPAMFEVALAALEAAPGDVVYIGDDPHDDVLGATRAGIATILLDRGTPVPAGARTPEPLATVPGDRPALAAELARRHLEGGP